MSSRVGKRRLGAAVLILVVALTAMAVAIAHFSHRRPPTEPPDRRGPGGPSGPEPAIGTNMSDIFNRLIIADRPAAEASLDAAQAAGVRLVRTDALWEFSEPKPPRNGLHTYDWRFDDRIATELARRGIRWEPIIAYSPAWAATDARFPHSPPRSTAEYAAYAAAFARRYGTGGELWRAHPELPQLWVTSMRSGTSRTLLSSGSRARTRRRTRACSRHRGRASERSILRHGWCSAVSQTDSTSSRRS